jgi:uncharacterized protein YbcI
MLDLRIRPRPLSTCDHSSFLIETARPVMEEMVQEATGSKVVSLHHDISTGTGEEVMIFTLAESPIVRESRKLQRAGPL